MSAPATIYAWDLISIPTTVSVGESPPNAAPVGYDLAFDHQTGTFIRAANGDLTRTFGVEAVAQGIRIQLLAFYGEWFVDLTRGTPWLEFILVKAPNIPAVISILRDRILLVPGVRSVTTITANFDRRARTLSVNFAVNSDFGELTDSLPIPVPKGN